MCATADEVIRQLDLAPHPEGGWFRETWRAPMADGRRAAGTAIHYLLKRGERSHWHRIDATELWLHRGGGALRLRTAREATVAELRLGSDLANGDLSQAVVAPGEWQAAETQAEWALAACVVVPGFEFAGFELAPPGWEPGRP